MIKTWTLEELEALPNEELSLLIPIDIDTQYDKLPVCTRVFKIKDLHLCKSSRAYKVYTTREGYIELLNNDRLYIKDTNMHLTGV